VLSAVKCYKKRVVIRNTDLLDCGKMDEREKDAARKIATLILGMHFSTAVGKYLIKLVEVHMEQSEPGENQS
jgi:hypothetical protein